MSEYPVVVEKIINDYLERLKAQLKTIPAGDHQEIMREVQSHIYESYHNESTTDEVDRILGVLKKLGEPYEVAATHIPEAMVAIGKRKKLPLYILGGVAALLFGVPLGLGGVGILVGLLLSVLSLLVAFCAVGVSMVVAGLLTMVLGVIMVFYPEFVSKLLMMGYIQLDWGALGLNHIPLVYQGILVVLMGLVFAAIGLGILWLGKYFFRGLRYLANLVWKKTQDYLVRRKNERGKTATNSI